MYGYIYKTVDLKTNKIYIGKKHSKSFLGINYIGSGKIIKLIKEYCIKNQVNLEERFSVELLDTAESLQELNEKEIYWIKKFNSRDKSIGYNIRKGGDCGPGGPFFSGHKHTEETKHNMSLNRIGDKNGMYGKHHSEETKKKCINKTLPIGPLNGMFGKKQSEKQKELNIKAQTGVKFFSNKEKDIVLRFEPGSVINEEELLSKGFIKGNWHCTKEYKLLSKEQRLSKT